MARLVQFRMRRLVALAALVALESVIVLNLEWSWGNAVFNTMMMAFGVCGFVVAWGCLEFVIEDVARHEFRQRKPTWRSDRGPAQRESKKRIRFPERARQTSGFKW